MKKKLGSMAKSIVLIACVSLILLTMGIEKSQAVTKLENSNEMKKTTPAALKAKPVDYGELGFVLMDREIKAILGGHNRVADVVKKFGKPEKKSKVEVWGADGLKHQTYFYTKKGLEIGLVTDENNRQTVCSISIEKKSKVKTKRGIGVGSSKAAVLKAYAAELDMKENANNQYGLVAGTVYGGVIFGIEKNRVTSIFIGAAAE